MIKEHSLMIKFKDLLNYQLSRHNRVLQVGSRAAKKNLQYTQLILQPVLLEMRAFSSSFVVE